jgi:hypothetical protein
MAELRSQPYMSERNGADAGSLLLSPLRFFPSHHYTTSVHRPPSLGTSSYVCLPLVRIDPDSFDSIPLLDLAFGAAEVRNPFRCTHASPVSSRGLRFRVLSHGRSSLSPVGQTRSKRDPRKPGLFPECGPLHLPRPAPRSVKSPLCWLSSASSRPPLVRHSRAPESSSHSRQASASFHPTLDTQNRATPAGCL